MLVLTSDPRSVAQVAPFVEQVASECAVRPDKFGDILLTLTEAVTNAILHGNCGDTSKKVYVRCTKSAQRLIFRVSDEGCGFNPDSLPDPTAPENLLSIGGRGVFLMRQLSDRIAFLDNGSTVELGFSL